MKFLKSEDGVSEVVGAMLILLIMVLFLGILQASEVPKWNKELERQHFDTVSNDFVNLRSSLEDVSVNSIPKTGSLHMGVRYPQRFMLQNPGSGASGLLTFEPANVVLKIGSTEIAMNSTRIVYELQGTSSQPKLVYEHGLIIRDFGNAHLIEGNQSMVIRDSIFVPVIFAPLQFISGIETETINILPADKDYQVLGGAALNITLETKYPDVWRNLSIPDVTVSGTGEAGLIYINRSIEKMSYPKPSQGSGFYTGMITDMWLPTSGFRGLPWGATGQVGQYVNERGMVMIDIPTSSELQEFLISDITVTDAIDNSKFGFFVSDKDGSDFHIEVLIRDDTTIDKVELNGTRLSEFNGAPLSGGINLTSYYKNASIDIPNSLVTPLWESPQSPMPNRYSDIIYFRFVII